MSTRLALLVAVIVSGPISPCAAQQVPTEPSSTHIFPAGGRRGTVVPVRVGGEFLPPYTRFRLFGEGVAAPPDLVERVTGTYEPSPRRKPGGSPINYPREWKSEIAIAADAPPGQKLWRVSSARGGSGGRPFLVGDLPEFIETESNSIADKAEPIALPVTVNGQIAGERDLDYFQFEAILGAVVVVEVAAARLGSPLDPVVEIFDARGRRLGGHEVRMGTDPILAVHIPATGAYRLLVSNLNLRGGPQYVYRIMIATVPAVSIAVPSGGESGKLGSIDLLSLAGEGAPGLTGDAVGLSAGTPRESTMPDAARSGAPASTETTDLRSVTEVEPNDTVAAANSVLSPVIAHGRLSADTDDDWYAFSAGADQTLTFECEPVPRGSAALPTICLCDRNRAILAKASAVELSPKPCRLEWRAPADGRFFVRVQDVGRGSTATAYRLCIRPTRPDFALEAVADIVNVLPGGREELELRVDRQGGLAGPIDLTIEGLPEGVTLQPSQIPAGQELVKVGFSAIDDARPGDSLLKITGSAKAGEETIVRTARAAHLGRDVEGASLGEPTVDHVQLTVRHKQVFRLYCHEAYQYAHRGTIYPYLMEVERMNGFDGPISLEMGDRQIMDLDGVEIVNSTFPAGTSKLMLPLFMPETMHINVQPHSNIYAQGYVVFQDKWGQRQSMVQVSEMRCMIRPLPTVAKLRAREKALSIRAGESRTCTLLVDRTSNFSGPMRLELVGAPMGIHMAPVLIPADQSEASVTIIADPGIAALPMTHLKFRGTGDLPGDVKVVSEITMPATTQ